MMSIRLAAGLLVCGAALLASPALAEPPHIRVGDWQSEWDQASCLERVEEVMRSVGFVDDLDVDHDDVEGNQGTTRRRPSAAKTDSSSRSSPGRIGLRQEDFETSS